MAQREVHCAARDCGALDFLPRVCRHCSHPFCTTHASPPAHACAHDPALARAHGPRKFEGRFQDLVPDREASRADRKASEDKVKEEQQRKAQAGVEAMRARFAAAGVPKRGGTSAAPKRVNPALELIKLKGRAVPGDTRKSAANVPMDERVFLVAKCSDGEHDKGTQELWFHKVCLASVLTRWTQAHSRAGRLDRPSA